MQTGYGRLTFKLSAIKSAAKSEYKWPKDGDISKPTRNEEFEFWAKTFKQPDLPAKDKPKDQPKSDKKPEPNLGGERKDVPTEKAKDELGGKEFAEHVTSARKVKDDPELSVKERQDKFKAFGKRSCYLVARVDKTKEIGSDDDDEDTVGIQITFTVLRNRQEGNWYDARTGEDIGMWWYPMFAIAKKGLTQKEVDATNADGSAREILRSSGYGTGYVIDYSIAETLKKGDGIVFKLTYDCSSGKEEWTTEITRFKPTVEPIVESGK